MSILEDYEKTHGLEALTPDQILKRVELAELCLQNPAVGDRRLEAERIMVWLHDRLQAVCAALENPKAPVGHKCGWCWRSAGATQEAWNSLPKMDLDGVDTHVAVCEHNPLVQKLASAEIENRALTSELEDLRGRKLGNGDAWAEAASESLGMYDHMRGLHEAMKATIRALLNTEQPAGDLRRALGELVR